MREKILFVDDEPQILAALDYSLGQKFNIVTALEAAAGFKAIAEQGPFAVVVSDLHMPSMGGVKFLEAVKERSPDSVRLMLTSKGDLESAIQVVNHANIFRFLTKPCPADMLIKCLTDALQQYRLVMAEREILQKTLRGAIKVLTEILALVDSESFDRAVALQKDALKLATALNLTEVWQLEVAALLAPIGSVTIPASVLRKARGGLPLTKEEQTMVERAPEIGSRILSNIPRLETVAQIVLYQNKNHDGSGFPSDRVKGETIPAGARILKVLLDLAELKRSKIGVQKAFEVMRQRKGHYDPKALVAAYECFGSAPEAAPSAAEAFQPMSLDELQLGYVLFADILTREGTLLISAGREITETILERLANFAKLTGVQEPILVENQAFAASKG